MTADQVFALRDGWFCIVGGKVFGPWESRGYALAGMQTEQRRRPLKAGGKVQDAGPLFGGNAA